jgi:hypothetical protein
MYRDDEPEPRGGTMVANDPDLIYQSAKLFLGDPLLQMEQAHQLVQERCKVSPLAFGVIGTPLLGGDYESARGYAEKNLNDGVDKVRETGEKLGAVAEKWGEVDAHNTIMLLANPTPAALPPLQSHGSPQMAQMITGGAGIGLGEGMEVIALLVARNAMIATGLKACRELEIMSSVAVVLWLMFQPDEGSINEAIDSWNNTNSVLTACGNAVTAAVGPATKGWSGDDRNAFDQYIVVLKNDLTDAATGAKTNADALLKIIGQLNDAQTTFLFIVMMAMVSIIILSVIAMSGTPAAPAAAMMKKMVGFEVAAATAEVLLGIYQTINDGLKPIKEWWSSANQLFARPRGSAPTVGGGSGTTFATVKINWV